MDILFGPGYYIGYLDLYQRGIYHLRNPALHRIGNYPAVSIPKVQ